MGQETQGKISRNHPALAGHFPGNPVVPGVVLLTELLRAIERELGWESGPVTVTAVKFMRLLRPNESFTLRLEPLSDREVSFAVLRAQDPIAKGIFRLDSSIPERAES
jgi:3-hydroxymyristoyl/3-hydroxydecanoyl-(acyl carrier protein) dehydratase